MSSHLNWDDPLPTELEPTWIDWKNSLSFLEKIEVPRQYASREQTCESSTIDLLIFSDASEDAIAAVVYIRINSSDKDFTIMFVMGKAKVAPSHGHSMPRLELCASVLAVEIYDAVVDALQVKINNVFFHTDSKVVLGYIHNRTRRFFMYVSNRVERIHQSSKPEQWKYISTKLNPADCATRPVCAEDLEATPWLKGPDLTTNSYTDISDDFPLVEPDNDTELRTVISSLRTAVTPKFTPVSERFSEFSTWWSLLKAISLLKHIVSTFTNKSEKCQGWHLCTLPKLTDGIQAAKLTILHAVQKDSFQEELESLKSGKAVSCRSPLYTLDPYLDDDNLMRVGGRLRKSKLPYDEKFPILLPKDHHVSLLLVRHYHQEVYHQGRHITQGALRTAGFWIIGERRLISSTIYRCIICKHLRGNQQTQKMSELPEDRLTPAPPFTYVGVDVFGPWNIVYRRTKGAIVNTKRWAVLFTCLLVRAVHIEVIEEMTSSCFINALRRFIAVRGPAREFRSDRGTNFVGSLSDLKVNVINVEDEKTSSYLNFHGITWKFNSPHSSHMGRVWERMIGVSRRILDCLLSGVSGNSLTHEVLVTFMCEVMAIINARPLVPVSTDHNNPTVLSPSVILNQKMDMDICPFDKIDQRDMCRKQWKRVQLLAEQFWKRWSSEFLQTLQKRSKWQRDEPNLKDGDVILMKQIDLPRNDWPLGIVTNAIKSDDGRVRKAEVRILKDGVRKVYTRPISELILLLSE